MNKRVILSCSVISLLSFCTVEKKHEAKESAVPNPAYEKLLKELKEDSVKKIEEDKKERIELGKQGIFGKWLCTLKYYESIIYFKKVGDGYSSIVDFDDTRSKSKTEILRKVGNSFFKTGDTSDYYVIKSDGNLELRDKQGLLTIAVNIMPGSNSTPLKFTSKDALGKDVFEVAGTYSKSSAETLSGTNNTYWIVYYADINSTFRVNKSTNEVLKVSQGKKPNLE